MTVEEYKDQKECYYPGDIADALIAILGYKDDQNVKDELTDTLYYIDTMACNKYNNNSWRTLAAALCDIARKNEEGEL